MRCTIQIQWWTNLRTIALIAAIFLNTCPLHAQLSASGCGTISEADAAEAPALPVRSALSVRIRPVPVGLPELSTLRIGFGVTSLQLGGWIDGRGNSDWTDVTVGAHMRWTIDSAYAFGIAPRFRSQWFRGFASKHAMHWDVQATTTYNSLTVGIALRDIPVAAPVPRPFLHASMMVDLSELRVALDMGMNAETEVWIGVTADVLIGDKLRIVGALRTQPAVMHVAMRCAVDPDHSITAACSYRPDIGITPEVAWIWSFNPWQ